MSKYALEWTGGQILNLQNTFDRGCDEINLEIQYRAEIIFESLISTRKSTLSFAFYPESSSRGFILLCP
jgi:hypothetical protein